MSYTVEQKAIAVAILERHGMSQQAFADIKQALGSCPSTSTLHAWLKSVQSVPRKPKPKTETAPKPKVEKRNKKTIPPETLQEARDGLDTLFERVAYTYLDLALRSDKTKDMKGKDLVTAAAIAVDKMRLLRDLPTEIVQILPQLVSAMQAKGLDPVKTFEAMHYELAFTDN